MKHYFAVTLLGLLMAITGLNAAAAADKSTHFHTTRAPVPPADCQAHVAYDRDLTLPGYLLPTSAGPRTCIPFTTVSAQPPAADKGDFYVDEFTDAKLRERWTACKADTVCYDRVYKQAAPVNRRIRNTTSRTRTAASSWARSRKRAATPT